MASLLITVGSTQFPALIHHLLDPQTLSALVDLGIDRLTIQHGTQPLPQHKLPDGLTLLPLSYTSNFPRLLSESDLVVSHAGSGTVLEAVKLSKPLVVVVNSSLMDNHQTELADAMSRCGCCQVLNQSHLTRLVSAIHAVMHRPDPGSLPAHQEGLFGAIVAQELSHADSKLLTNER